MVSGSLALPYFLLSFHGGRQGSGPDRGQSPVEWGDFPFVRSSVRMFVCPPLWAIQPGLRPSQPGLRPSQPDLRPSQPASQASGFRPGWLGLRPGWIAQGGNGRTDERTYGWTENLPTLQDFVSYWGRCPACPHENKGESRAGQGNR